jgi:diadenosine tetraphosphatase ApaH/serine/threonine PP2A family protein phosphatase
VRRLILSDIHANIDALEAVIDHADGLYDEIVCCGDLVGYGACPSEVVRWAKENVKLIVRGNHDRAAAGLEDAEWFNPRARTAVLWTTSHLGFEELKWLAALPRGPLLGDTFELAHGSPEDEDDYLLQQDDVVSLAGVMRRPVCFVGHTHWQGGWTWSSDEPQTVCRVPLDAGERLCPLEPAQLYLINPGSVGQPRDRDPRAAYAIFDDQANLLRFRRTRYDVEKAQQRIVESGLPRGLADRLAAGV